ncbi:MAG: hypothetical protein H6Q17_1410 [Bacteroidetes bacterium]|nr:hypothetical protein [Bacteroidota bacterium]
MSIVTTRKKLLFALLFLTSWQFLAAQSTSDSYLERRVTLAAIKQPIEKILNQLSEQVGCVFSYSTKTVNVQKTTTLKATNKPVKIVLDEIFDNQVGYITRGKYIILKPLNDHKSTKTTVLEGYVFDRKTGRQVADASVYDKRMTLSAITDQHGYFRIEVPRKQPIPNLQISKEGYADTLLLTASSGSSLHMMTLNLDENRRKKSSLSKFIPQWLLPRKLKIHTANLTDSIFRKVQFSLFPMVSTNALLTGNTQNDVSLNLTVGYVYAIRKFEVGGAINIVRTNASGCQLAGAGNIVGGTVSGFQGAGAFNVARTASGVQAAGAANIVSENATLQVAGAFNSARNSSLQLSGAVNIATDTADVQLGGAMNIAKESKVQISGAVNMAQESSVQLSGAVNIAPKSTTTQITGAVNIAGKSNVQIAAVNIARHVKNLQLGVINIADSCSGIPLGLFSYVRSGYHRLEASIDESSFATIAYRSGVQRFHTFFEAGVATKHTPDRLFTWGYGIGTSLGKTPKMLVDFDLSVRQFATSSTFLQNGNHFKLYCGIDRKVTSRLSVAVGVAYNMLVYKNSEANQQAYSSIAPYTLTNNIVGNNTCLKSWIGGKVALRFL